MRQFQARFVVACSASIVFELATDFASLRFGGYRQKVLTLLLLHPEQRYPVRAIARLTDTSAGTLHKELAWLAPALPLPQNSTHTRLACAGRNRIRRQADGENLRALGSGGDYADRIKEMAKFKAWFYSEGMRAPLPVALARPGDGAQ